MWYFCCRMGKHFKLSSSTKWRLGVNVALRLTQFLTSSISFDIFMDNYFISFRLLTLLGATNIRTTRVLCKNRLRKCAIIGEKQLPKQEHDPFKQYTWSKKKQRNFDSGCLEQYSFFWILLTSEIYLVLEQSWKKIYSRIATQSVPLLQAEHGICQHIGSEHGHILASEWKNGGVSRLFEWLLFFRVRGYCILLIKMKAMSLCL